MSSWIFLEHPPPKFHISLNFQYLGLGTLAFKTGGLENKAILKYATFSWNQKLKTPQAHTRQPGVYLTHSFVGGRRDSGHCIACCA